MTRTRDALKRTIYLDADLWQALQKHADRLADAERRQASVSELVRRAVEEWLDRRAEPPSLR